MFKKQVKCSDCGFLSLSGAEDIAISSPRNRLEVMQLYKEVGMIGLLEVKQKARHRIKEGITNPVELSCARNIWNKYDMSEMVAIEAVESLNRRRTCPYYFEYTPGYKPTEHLELQRERTQRRFLIIVSILSAAIGAVIATLANLIWSLVSS
jgi:hypothetical protein